MTQTEFTSQAQGTSQTQSTTQESPVIPSHAEKVDISEEELYDKLVGGWIGQMLGVSWAASTEFRWQGKIIPEADFPKWSPDMINSAFGQDDLYVEIPFLDAMKENGAFCDVKYMADKFRDSTFPLWHANKVGRDNLRAGIEYPDSGHYLYNHCADDIDWQIEADFLGQIYPGLVNASAKRSFDIGHIMNYGDGVYGGVFVTAMHAAAYTADSIEAIVEAGISVIPEGTKFRSVMDDVVQSYESGQTWEECWQMLEEKWAYDDKCMPNSPYNIDAKLNAAYILIGLLWGEGDMEKTVVISGRCGQDSDCNPSSAASVLGNYLGASGIDDIYKKALDRDGRKFSHTSYTFDDVMEISFKLMKDILTSSGAECADGVWSIYADTEYETVPYEQWGDAVFEAMLTVSSKNGGVVDIGTAFVGSEKLASFTLDMGDGFTTDCNITSYSYSAPGTYKIRLSAVSENGTESSCERTVVISDKIKINGKAVCSVTAPTGGGSKDVSVIFDGDVPAVGSDSSSSQYDTYCGGEKSDYVWAGVEFDRTYTVSGVEFTEGKHFLDGGWFREEPYVEVLVDGEWLFIPSEISKEYPKNLLGAQGKSFETYTFSFGTNIECDGVRIVGKPGGSAYFISVGEITPICEEKQVFGDNDKFIICSVTAPTGGGSKDISVICDGKKGTSSASQYDTFRKDESADEAYIGYIYKDERTVKSVEFTEGGHFRDGGWFRDGDVRIELYIDGKWVKAEYSASPAYPKADSLDSFGAGYETYVFTLKTPAKCRGVRVIGSAGGSAGFISVSELTVK